MFRQSATESVQYGGVKAGLHVFIGTGRSWDVSFTRQLLMAGAGSSLPIRLEAGWTPEPICKGKILIFPLPGMESQISGSTALQ
jgi:hypothetical protein